MLVTCRIETRPNGRKYVLAREPDSKSILSHGEFEIIIVHSKLETYTIVLPDDFVGWVIDTFDLNHYHVDNKFFGKRFWDITEEFILEDETKVVNKRQDRIKTYSHWDP